MTSPQLPPAVWQRIRAFLAAGATGQIQLDVKDGRILAWRVTEYGRVDAGAPSHAESGLARSDISCDMLRVIKD